MSKPFVHKTPYTVASHIPRQSISRELMDKLYLTITEGDYKKINEFILENNITTQFINDIGESILHIIIKSSLPPSVKYNLTELCMKHGAQVSASDKHNITPLHYACKYQLKNIAELLLQRGAQINSYDSQRMTPLHYAMIGNNTECALPKVKKPFIAKQMTASDRDALLQNLTKQIKSLVASDTTFTHNINHLSNYMMHYDRIFPEQYELFAEEFNRRIRGTVNSTDIGNRETKYQAVLQQVGEFNNILTRTYYGYTDSDDVIDLTFAKIADGDGWYPTGTTQYPFMKKYDDVLATIASKNTESLQKLITTKTEMYDLFDKYTNRVNAANNSRSQLILMIADLCNYVILKNNMDANPDQDANNNELLAMLNNIMYNTPQPPEYR